MPYHGETERLHVIALLSVSSLAGAVLAQVRWQKLRDCLWHTARIYKGEMWQAKLISATMQKIWNDCTLTHHWIHERA